MAPRKMKSVLLCSLLVQSVIIFLVYLGVTVPFWTIERVLGTDTLAGVELGSAFLMGLAITALSYRKAGTWRVGLVCSIIAASLGITSSVPLTLWLMMRPEHRGYPFIPLLVAIVELYHLSGVLLGILLAALWRALRRRAVVRRAGQSPPTASAAPYPRKLATGPVPYGLRAILISTSLAQLVIVVAAFLLPLVTITTTTAYIRIGTIHGVAFIVALLIALVGHHARVGRWVAPAVSAVTGCCAIALSVFLGLALLRYPMEGRGIFAGIVVAYIEAFYMGGSLLGALLGRALWRRRNDE